MTFEIELHLGDVIVEGDDLYGDGDGVNVTARLEGEAPRGGIVFLETCITHRRPAQGDVRRPLPTVAENIERPAQAYVMRWEVGDWPITVPTALEPVTKGLNSNASGSRYRCPDCAILEVGSSCPPPAHSKCAELRSRFLNHFNVVNEAY